MTDDASESAPPSWLWPRIWRRMRQDFALAVILLCGVCAALGILPFALYRWWMQEWLAAVIDSALVLGILGTAAYAWVRGETRGPGRFMVVIDTCGCVVLVFVAGDAGLYWLYPVLLANFFLAASREAALANLLALLVLAVNPQLFDGTLHQLMFLMTAGLVSLFALIFAQLTESQRRELENLAGRDPLTGSRNRRAMQHELSARHRASEGEALLMLDLDHFKRINDRYGHEAGDQVLVAAARSLQSGLLRGELLFRFGGEEFVILLGRIEPTVLQTRCEALRERIARDLHGFGDGVTVSIGAARRISDEDVVSWLARADGALYRAKAGGRDRAELDA